VKLFVKYNRINVSATIIVFLIGSISFYFLLRYILINQLDHSLESEHQEIVNHLAIHNALPEINNTKNEYTGYAKVAALYPVSFHSIQREIYNKDKWVREVQFGEKVSNDFYLITVDIPLEETEDLLQAIILVSICIIALILVTSYLINRQIISRLWKPFYQSIDQVKNYNLSSQQSTEVIVTNIDEFSLLNQSIQSMTERIQKDYQSLKDFTGHAAHEMQTPLSVIRNKFDLFIQNADFVRHNPQYITDIEEAVNKLSRLYQSLLLLTKVENRQFILNEKIDLEKIIKVKYAQIAELAASKNIDIVLDTTPFFILFHQQLAEIVINNLFNNAFRYNKVAGRIEVLLKDDKLSVANTSEIPELDSELIFQRFYRHSSTKEDGNGLGLSIVKQICDLANYKLMYAYTSGMHTFTIQFNTLITTNFLQI